VLTSYQLDKLQDDKISLSSKARVQQQLMKSTHQKDSVSNGSIDKKYVSKYYIFNPIIFFGFCFVV